MKLMKATLRRLWRLTGATSSLVSLAVMVAVCLIVGAGGAGTMAAAASCDTVPTGVATEDYLLDFKVPKYLMPDNQFHALPAQLHVHRVKPVYANGKCSGVATQAAVLIHGRTTPGPVVFDLREPSTGGGALSVQEGLARAGIDTFAPSLLGYGKSSRFSLNDPENASLGPCPTNGTLPPPEGCDRTANSAINPLDQQGRPLNQQGELDWTLPSLWVNPLDEQRSAHSSNFRFGRIDVWVRGIDQVILDSIARAKPTDGKVALVGYSAGGVRVGRTLYADNPLSGKLGLEDRHKIIDKVSRVAFVNSLFFPAGPTNEDQLPNPNLPTFPLTLESRAGSDENWRMATSTDCPGRIIEHTQDQVWNQTMDQETVGRDWGGDDPNNPTGLNRAPTFSTYGWNSDVAGQLSKPTLVIQGLEDGVLPARPIGLGPETGEAIYENLRAAPNKVLVKVECASHALPWEGSSSTSWAGPHSTLKKALIEWITSGTFNGAANGKFTVDKSGGVSGG